MSRTTFCRAALVSALTACAAIGGTVCVTQSASASARPSVVPGNLLVSRLHYAGTAMPIVAGTTVLPTGSTAIADSSFAHVWDNVNVDGNFGVSAPIYLDQITPSGAQVSTLAVPTGTPGSSSRGHDLLTGSFSSKSEGALTLSTAGTAMTFMGYVAPVGTLDVSNSNTPGVVDPTNPDTQSLYRGVGQLDENGKFWFTKTNAYSGDNGRAAVLDNSTRRYFTAGNSNNGDSTATPGLIYGTGAQVLTPRYKPERRQKPGQPTPAGGFSVTQLGITKPDKLGKDTNFAGVTIHDGVVYYTKGSGSNGVDSVYFIDTTGTACPTGIGTPVHGAPAPSAADTYNPTTGEPAYNMCILKGFPTALAKSIKTPEVGGIQNATAFNAIWFANDTTLYVADAGNGSSTFDGTTYSDAANQTLAGIQKWSLADGTWTYDYTLQAGLGLGLGVPYAVAGLPTGANTASGTPWTPAVDGIRNITGKVKRHGTVTLYGVTNTIGGVTDAADSPNKLVAITDRLAATTAERGKLRDAAHRGRRRRIPGRVVHAGYV